jgi:hypothetical protein
VKAKMLKIFLVEMDRKWKSLEAKVEVGLWVQRK